MKFELFLLRALAVFGSAAMLLCMGIMLFGSP